MADYWFDKIKRVPRDLRGTVRHQWKRSLQDFGCGPRMRQQAALLSSETALTRQLLAIIVGYTEGQ